MIERLLSEQQAIEILEHYVPAGQLDRVRTAINLPTTDWNPKLQERTYLFENTLVEAHIEVLLTNGRETSVYLIWIPKGADRLSTRKEYCMSIADALQKICWGSSQPQGAYRFVRWWIHDEEDYDLKEAWRDRDRHASSRFIGIWQEEAVTPSEANEDGA